ncbi:urea-proton symporter DUR3-like [Brachionus plicatilis]|uniref:Urea-proton symporter DUR3-like n=1 Tax=Brachionus plicatilis TaxID=10195 RepID=A0A3M7STP9_BRAPC|nr:urea-proton symporter DUR3-like [Brachionus plicatilis]
MPKCLEWNNFTSYKSIKQPLLTANVTFLSYMMFTLVVAVLFLAVQRKSFKSKLTLTTTFNAGGSMSISLLSSTIVSQWTWAATLLQSTTVGTRFGLSGSYWYAGGACIQILLFSILCMEVRIKAPGSRTFLQIIQARFDKKTHMLFCIYALLTNLIVSAMLIVGGIACLTYSFKDLSPEYSILLFILAMSIYVFFGGLGGLFYLSYFSTLVILIVIVVMFMSIFYVNSSTLGFGSIKNIFDRFSCISNPNNLGNSYKTFFSLDSFLFGVINLIGNCGTVFVDQAYWQLNSTTSPKKSSIAFIIAGVIWFFVPFTFGTTMSVAYIYLDSFNHNLTFLTPLEINSGLVAPAVAALSYGNLGNYLINLMIIFAVTTTGGGEILAITSIILNDIYSVYIHPFKPNLSEKDSLMCILCDKIRGQVGDDKCMCCSITYCKSCDTDNRMLKNSPNYIRSCSMHASYLNYEQHLNSIKSLVIVLITIVMLVVSILLFYLKLNLNWLYLFMGIIVGPAVFPIALSLFWARMNSFSMFFSALSGSFVGIISWILTTVIYFKGFDIEKSGNLISMLAGNVASLGIGGIMAALLTFLTSKPLNVDQIREVWEKTRDIDSPLLPWSEIYSKEMNIEKAYELKQRPSLLEVESELRTNPVVA